MATELSRWLPTWLETRGLSAVACGTGRCGPGGKAPKGPKLMAPSGQSPVLCGRLGPGAAEEPRHPCWPLHVRSERSDASSLQDCGPQGIPGTQEEKDPGRAGPRCCRSGGTDGAAGPPRRAETGSISYAQTLLNGLANRSFPSLFMPEHLLFVNGKVSS